MPHKLRCECDTQTENDYARMQIESRSDRLHKENENTALN